MVIANKSRVGNKRYTIPVRLSLHFSEGCVCVLGRVWLWDSMECCPPGPSVRGILQARILEWGAMPSSWGSSQPGDWTQVSCGSCVGKRMLYHRATWEAPSEGSRSQNKPEPPVVINVMDWNVTGWGAWKDELLWGRVIVSLCKSGQDRLCEKVIFEWTPGNSKGESCVSVLEEFRQRVNKPRKSWRGNTPHMEPEEASERRWDGWRNSDRAGPCRPLKNTTFYLGWIRKALKVTMLNLTWALCSWKPETVQETPLLLYPGEWLTAKNYSSTHD